MLSILLSGFLTFVSLNCENLFDCRHDTLKNDAEWLPDGDNHWTKTRYWKKVNNIGQEILACGSLTQGEGDAGQMPDLVALCEVENDSVLNDICGRSLLRNARYKYVATDSPDTRGVDVALLYSPYSFQPDLPSPFACCPLARHASHARHPLCLRTAHHGRYAPRLCGACAQSFGR